MISTTDQFSALKRTAPRKIRPQDWNYAITLMERFCAPMPTEEPFDWAVSNLILDDPEVKGAFSPEGRQYLRDIINDNNDPDCREQTVITGTGIGKTLTNIAGIVWKIVHHPCRGLMVMPATKGEGGAETFVNSRLIPALEATRATQELMPNGQRRLFMNSKKVRLNGSHFGFVGANSSSQIASNRCGDIRMDEADKFKGKLGNEAGTASLVKERIEGVVDYQIFLNTTPTIETGLGWKNLMRSDFRRRFLPCPKCNPQPSTLNPQLKGWFTLGWSEQYSVLPTKLAQEISLMRDETNLTIAAGTAIPTAYIAWDKEAKRKDGSFDLDRVFRSTRLECPHCKAHIHDADKIWMDKNGLWIPTQHGTPHHKGYHLSSLYAPPLWSNENSLLGGRALKFLNAHEDGEGMKGFINSTLAEVDVAQESIGRDIIEICSDEKPQIGSVLKWPMMSVDRQAKYPGFWYIIRNWVLSILRPIKTLDQQTEFLKQLPTEEKNLSEKITGTLFPSREETLYSPHNILAQIQRTDHWPKIVEWLIGNSLTEKRLTEFFQVEFQTDLIRLVEFICKQKEVNIVLERQGDSEAIEIGSADSWEELDDAQRRYKIANPDVIVDARFGAFDNAEVFAECFRRCPPQGFCFFSPIITPFGPRGKFSKTPLGGYKPFAEWGWCPALGHAEHKTWVSKEKIRLPYAQEINDPFIGKMEQRQFYQWVFKFDAQWALSELARIRKRYAWTLSRDVKFVGQNAEMNPVNLAEYNRHMKGYFWDEKNMCWDSPAKHGGSQSRRHPNHLYDCEKNCAARAVWKGIFKYQRPDQTEMNPQEK